VTLLPTRRRCATATAACALTLAITGPAAAQGKPNAITPAAAAASHARMLEVLRAIQERTPDDNPFFGTRSLREKRAELEQRGAAAPWKLRMDTALAELQLGHEREAIDLLAATRAGLQSGAIAGDAAAKSVVAFHLGVAWLRLGETQNCCKKPTIDSCVLPLRGGGLHTDGEGSHHAIPCFLEVLAATRNDDYWHFAALWLLNLAHMTLGTWPAGVPKEYALPASAFAPECDFPAFENIAPLLGLDTFGLAGGIVVDDFDGDGCLDVLRSDWHTSGQIRFWHNERDGTFADRTIAAGLQGICGGLNLVQADYDNDGDLDVLVLRGGWWAENGRQPKSLLRNDGNGHFTDVTFAAGLGGADYPSQTAAFADIDNDGDLDLFIGNESSSRIRCPSQLFLNQGDGTFVEAGARAGVQNFAYAKGCSFGDYDNDRFPDLYVSNLASDNRLYHNRGDGTFVDVAKDLGVTAPESGFGAWFWDFDNDGVLDIFASCYATGVGHVAAWHLDAKLPYDHLRLYRGDGHGGFTDVAARMGLDYPALPMGCNFGDLDNDGWPDFYLGTGDPYVYTLVPNLMYRNVRGERFQSVTFAGRFGLLQKGHAIAFADWDNDGDVDVFEAMGGANPGDGFRDVLFQNPGFGNHWLTVQLVGTVTNRCAIGARIRAEIVEDGAHRNVFRHVNSGASFGGNPLRQTIGLGKASRLAVLEVFWPTSNTTQRFIDVAFDRAIRITEGSDRVEDLNLPRLVPKAK
jgi:hypothetical protein